MRPLPLALGLLVLASAWLGPLPGLAGEVFAAHMAMHVAVVAVAAPSIAIGLAGSRLDPSARLPRLFSPVAASLAELAVVWGWHAPAAHDAARSSSAVLAVEQASFLMAGLLVWLACVGRGRDGDAKRGALGVLGLLLTSMHMTLLGALLALGPRPLYAHGHAPDAALADQHLGGVLMLLVGGASYLLGGLYLMARLLRDPAPAADRPLDRAGRETA